MIKTIYINLAVQVTPKRPLPKLTMTVRDTETGVDFLVDRIMTQTAGGEKQVVGVGWPKDGNRNPRLFRLEMHDILSALADVGISVKEILGVHSEKRCEPTLG